MNSININDRIPELKRSPHKMVVVAWERNEHDAFRLKPKEALKKINEFSDIDEKTNITMIGIDGDLGNLSDAGMKQTHLLFIDFRPIGIYGIYYDW